LEQRWDSVAGSSRNKRENFSMASLEKRANNFRIVFRFGGRKFSRALKTRSDKAAAGCLARLEDNLRRLELGTLALPAGADVASFLLSDGAMDCKPKAPAAFSLAQLLDGYADSLPAGGLEQTTLDQISTHVRHLKRVLGERVQIQSLELQHLQSYIDERAKAKGRHGRRISAITIKKELVTFASAWGWAAHQGIVDRPFPKRGMRFPKTTEKPPFQTWKEIEHRIDRGGLTEAEQADLWDCLFLTRPEIAELLTVVKTNARHSFVYPMFVFAAHTGARRSEIIRSTLDDIDFAANTVTIHEKKRVRGKLTTRRVPMSPLLSAALRQWIANHPGGRQVFCHGLEVKRSKKARLEFGPLSRNETHDHFKRTLAGSKWEKLRGWHVFRHSFCSNCAAAGIDQRIINGWVGHQTEEMVRRYRHGIPDQQQSAMVVVFGNGEQTLVAKTS
jgi:integrase